MIHRLTRLSVLALALSHSALAAEPSTGTVTTTGAGPAVEKKKEDGPTYKFNALLQAWTVSDNSSNAPASLNFRLRRAELKLSGNVVPEMRYFVMADPAKAITSQSKDNPTADNRVLQDLGVGVTVVPGLEVVAGQFKILTTAEGLSSSAELLFPERSVTTRAYGDKREPGLMVQYTGDGFKIGAMASNGQGTNIDANKTEKDLSLRGDVTVVKNLTAGAFVQLGDLTYDRKGAYGVNARFSPTRELNVGAEFDAGRLAGVSSYGFVFDAGYLVTPTLQPVLRHEFFKMDSSKATLSQQTTVGINYLLFRNQAKLQAALSVLTNMTGNNGTAKVASGVNGPAATLVFQASI